jgi:membrane associated rhomboid family serine protease
MIKNQIKTLFFFIGLLYFLLLVDLILPIQIKTFGIVPRTKIGLIGIVTAPFLHGNLMHLVSNTIPLTVLVSVLMFFYPKKLLRVMLQVILLGGVLVWCFGRPGNHIGASGLIYGLMGFLVANGLIQRNFKAISIAVAVVAAYSGLIYGIFPTNPSVSWEGHLFGAVAGIFASYELSKIKTK